MKILNLFEDNLSLKLRIEDKIIESNSLGLNELILLIKKEDVHAIIFDAKAQEKLIDQLLEKNNLFPCVAITDMKNPIFPKEMNPFHCLTKEDVENSIFASNIKKLVINYNKKINEAKIVIHKEINNAKDYEIVTKADKLLNQASWGEYPIPERKNPLIDVMDRMIKTSEDILAHLKKDQ